MPTTTHANKFAGAMGKALRILRDGATVSEIADTTGHHPKWVREQLRAMIDDGRIKVGRRPSKRIDMVSCYTPVYILKSGASIV